MKIIAKKQSDGTLRIDAEASVKDVDKAFNLAALDFARQMNLRPEKDKSIQQVALEKLGIKNLDSVVENQVMENLIPMAIDKKGVIPAYPPKAAATSALRRGKEFTFRLDLMPKPEYELSSYDPIEITVPAFVLDQTQVDAEFDKMKTMYTDYEAAEGTVVEKGVACKIKMDANKDGVPMPALCMDGRTYVAGEGYMPDGFDENILGMKVGETKTFTFEGPGFDENFNEIMETVTCTVTVLETQQAVVPTFDDEWVKKYMPMYKDAAGFKKSVVDRVEADQRAGYNQMVANAAVSAIAKRFQGSIADEIYENMQTEIIQGLQRNLAQQGRTMEEFQEQMGGKEQMSMLLMVQTREQLVSGFSLDAVFRHFKLVLSDDDLIAVCRGLNPQQPTAVRKEMEETGKGFALREMAERYAATNYLVEHATITYEGTQAAAE